MNIRYFSLVLLLILYSFSLSAQNSEIRVRGRVVDSKTNTPIEFATVMIGDKNTQKPITGMTTKTDGAFVLKANTKNIYIEVSFIGYKNQRIDEVEVINSIADVGVILLVEDNQMMDEILVEGEKSTTEFKLDKRVFNVGKDLSSTGASALDVLNNVPSVNVNIEGQISLRGSQGVQILINGKPSVLTSDEGNALGTITADMIDRIEVITNPSAKYDAEGTSGIINIVIKKDERKGSNGSLSVNTGTPHNHSFGLSLNRRTEKFNLFTQLGVGYRELPNDVANINSNLNTLRTTRTEGEQFRNEVFYNVVLGADYHINANNVLTLSGNFAYEVEDQPSRMSFITEVDGALESQWIRNESTEATNPKYQYELQYKSNFKGNEDHTLLFSALGSFFGKDQSSVFSHEILSGTPNLNDQQTRTDFKEAEYTFKLDYTKPFTDKIILETGAQYVLNDVSNDFEVKDLVGTEFISNPDFTNIFEYEQNVLGVYTTGAYEGDKWGVKLGLRVENTDLSTLLVNDNQTNNQNYTNLFPSFHTSYKFTQSFSLQGGYSRRIFRPRLWDLNPFFNIRNTNNIRAGNPNLLPEFTNSYEIAAIYDLEDASFNFGVYHRHTTAVIERVRLVETESDTVTTTPFNIGSNSAIGFEINAKYTPANWLTINGDFNYNYFDRQGTQDFDPDGADATNLRDFSADRWSTKITAKFKLPAKIDFEITGRYNSSVPTIQQGIEVANKFLDLGVRKKIMKGKGVLNFSIRDVFASRINKTETNQENFFIFNRRQRGRFITFGFSFGFGKGEAMEYSGQRRR